MERLLALPSSNLPLVYQNPLSNLVNSLPYLDDEIYRPNEALRGMVSNLLEDEMKRMPKVDYLANLKMPEVRLAQKPPEHLHAIDTTRYNVEHIAPHNTNDAQSYMKATHDLNTLMHYNSGK